MTIRILGACAASLALAALADAQLIVSAPNGQPYSSTSISAYRVDVTTGAVVPLWRGHPEAFAVRDSDGKVFFPSGSIFSWSYDGQSAPVLHGSLGLYPGGQYIPMSGATFALGTLWGVAEFGQNAGFYEIVLAPAGQPSFAHLRKAFSQQTRGLAFDPATSLFYTVVEGGGGGAGLYELDITPNSGPAVKIAPLPPGVTEVGGLTYGNGMLWMTPPGDGGIRTFALATGHWTGGSIPSPFHVAGTQDGGAGWAPSLVPAPLPPAKFCDPKPSYFGCIPAIGWSGAASASAASGFTISASSLLPGKPGLLLYQLGGPRSVQSFYGVSLCFGPAGIRRAPGSDSGGAQGCSGAYALDMNAFAAGALGGNPAAGLSVPGTLVNCRYWGRDAQPIGTVEMTEALEYLVQP